jgi:MYXO-CTERM domain-containing protein
MRTQPAKAIRALSALALATLATPAMAATFSGSSGSLAAQAEFSVSGTNLVVRLTNTSVADVMVPSNVLTGVFFDVSGPSISLTPVSALLSGGSTVVYGPDNGGNVGGEWDYASGISGGAGGAAYGISSSGLGFFGSGSFGGPNLQGPASVDGLQYGITSAGDNPATGNTPVTGTNALIKHEVRFTLSGLPAHFDLARVGNVWFQYGTSTSEPQIETPAPGPLAILGLGLAAAARRRRTS